MKDEVFRMWNGPSGFGFQDFDLQNMYSRIWDSAGEFQKLGEDAGIWISGFEFENLGVVFRGSS